MWYADNTYSCPGCLKRITVSKGEAYGDCGYLLTSHYHTSDDCDCNWEGDI